MTYDRIVARNLLVETNVSEGELKQFDVLSNEQFELWYYWCYADLLAYANRKIA